MLKLFQKNKKPDLYEAIIQLCEDAVVVADANYNITVFNSGAERIFGYRKEDIIGQPLDRLIPKQFRGHHNRLIKEFSISDFKLAPMAERSRKIFGLRKDGSEFPASATVMSVGTPAAPYYAAILRDISEYKKTEDELMRLAATDPLTGALNRREFIAISEREGVRAKRYKRPLSVLMLDLDHFKQLNDNFGHAAGDKALQRFTSLCCNALRNIDIFSRWGGEEFVALLPETGAEGAAVIAERLRQIVSREKIENRNQKYDLTVSIGVAQFREGETTIDGPLSRADAAVYDAKKAGRNRVAVYRDDK